MRDGGRDEGEERDALRIDALRVVIDETDQLHDRVEEENAQHHRDHDVHAHQLLAVPAASRDPHHHQHRVRQQEELGEGQNAVQTGGDVAVRVHDDGSAVDDRVARIRVAHSDEDPVLALLRNIVVQDEALLLTTTLTSPSHLYVKTTSLTL